MKGFTLIELLVGMAIIIMIAGGGSVYVNNFRARQDLKLARDELINNLRLARNLALSSQKPAGNTDKVAYVVVTIGDGGVLTASTPAGVSFFSQDVTPNGVAVSSSGNIWFQGYEGRLVKLVAGKLMPLGSNEVASITLSSPRVSVSYAVRVKASGTIDYVEVGGSE